MPDKPQPTQSAVLLPFPNWNTGHSPDIEIFIVLNKNRNHIVAEFSLHGDTKAIRWPALAATAGQGTQLWMHTCFELFIAWGDNHSYWEYNFSPSQLWAIYAFEDYRKPTPTAVLRPPEIKPPQLTRDSFSLQAGFTLGSVPADKPINVGACAVIETVGDQHFYYALTHCGDKPDFHRRESFIIKLD